MTDQYEELCSKHSLRLTEHRRIVLQVLEESTDHPTVFEIHRRAAAGRRIGLPTIYRTLNRLSALGTVLRRDFGDGKARYTPDPLPHKRPDIPSRRSLERVQGDIAADLRPFEPGAGLGRSIPVRRTQVRRRLIKRRNIAVCARKDQASF
jgi:hypothetical protein